jgi:diadenylate cyclase
MPVSEPIPPVESGSLWSRLVEGFGWRDAVDILVVAFIIAYLLRAIRDTRAFQMLRGLAILLVAALICRHLELETTVWLLNGLVILWAIALIVVLQPELRRLISSLGEQKLLSSFFPSSPAAVYHEIAEAAQMMGHQGWGGLIIVERRTSLAGFAESGTRIDSDAKAELLAAIFTPGSPLHDGAVIIRDGRIYAAACMLPLSETRTRAQALGMRHRAALGITEETDALAVIVSEEERKTSLAMSGQLTPPLDQETLEDLLNLHGRGAAAAAEAP